MSAEQLLREGKATLALEALQKRVKSSPADAGERMFLFQLLAVLGQWERSVTQLKVAGQLDAGMLILVELYRHAIDAEGERARVFAGVATPVLIGEPASWTALLLEALRLAAAGRHEPAAELRDQALAQATACPGTVNGERFEWISDMDSRLGPCLELIVDGRYLWAPFERVRSLKMEPPADLRDAVWSQAIVTWTNGGQSPALIPARYPACQSDDDTIRLSRRTQWDEPIPGTYLGSGQRMLATNAGEYPLFEVRELNFDAPLDAAQ
jgi:type VI secretion system protein ImpE